MTRNKIQYENWKRKISNKLKENKKWRLEIKYIMNIRNEKYQINYKKIRIEVSKYNTLWIFGTKNIK